MLATLALVAVPPPTTVNGEVLGKAEDYATQGPARVCMRELAVQPEAGETVYLSYAGIHNGGLRLVTEQGQADFSMSEIYAATRPRGRLVRRTPDWRVYEREQNKVRTLFVWRTAPDESDRKLKLAIMITGSLLDHGDGVDTILRRATFKLDPDKSCNRTYAFGWDVLLGDEEMDEKKP